MYEAIRATQSPLFIESLEEAIAALAPVVGGKKKLAVLLRPNEDDATAYKWLLEALSADPDRRAVFKAKHLLLAIKIAREHNVHFLKHWVDDFTGYERTQVAPKLTEAQKLAVRRVQLAQELLQIADEEAALSRGDLNSDRRRA